MARVTSGFDPVLERPVALKRSLRGTPEEDAQLLREARLTAQLDHPAIAPVLDVGLDARGALVCVLHVRQGSSFGEAVRAAPPGVVPAQLLRALLAASQAVAHAHARGVLHRDLSPNNVRLADDGAVWVLDWGLAATREEAAAGGFRGGTSGSTAPEQREGGPTSAASDVWSLGALLHLLCARTLPTGAVTSAPRGVPKPLWAVCQRALSARPEARYPDARAFADELARWLDGQPLAAWPEGPWDRLVRLASRRPRLTVGVIAAALFALGAGFVAVTLVLRAQDTAREATATLLRESAERALAADDVSLARRLATRALASRDEPRARGVLATLARVAEVERLPSKNTGCEVLEVADGEVTCRSAKVEAAARFASGVLLTASQATARATLRDSSVPLPGGTPTISMNATRSEAVIVAPEGLVLSNGLELGSTLTPCTPGQPVRFAVPRQGGALAFCADDELVQISPTTTERLPRVAGLGSVLRGPVAGDLADDRTLLVGTADGHVGIIDLERSELTWVGPTGLGLLHTVLVSSDGRSAALLGAQGAGLFNLAGGHVLPVEESLDGVWRQAGSGFVGARRDGSLVELRARAQLAVTRGLHGRSALAVHEATRRIAVGDSFGTVQLAHLDEGVQQTIKGPVRVIKSLSFSRDGRFLALGAAGPEGLLVFDTAQTPARRVPGPWGGDPKIRARHVAFLDATHFVFVGWGAPPRAARFDPALERFVDVALPVLPGDVRDLAAREGEFFALDAEGALHHVGLDGVREQSTTLNADRIAVSTDGVQRAASTGAGYWRWGPRSTALSAVSAPVESLAVADDGRIALCRRDGVVELRGADERVLLEAPAHEQRCARVAFCDGQTAICSVGWDGRLRVISAN